MDVYRNLTRVRQYWVDKESVWNYNKLLLKFAKEGIFPDVYGFCDCGYLDPEEHAFYESMRQIQKANEQMQEIPLLAQAQSIEASDYFYTCHWRGYWLVYPVDITHYNKLYTRVDSNRAIMHRHRFVLTSMTVRSYWRVAKAA